MTGFPGWQTICGQLDLPDVWRSVTEPEDQAAILRETRKLELSSLAAPDPWEGLPNAPTATMLRIRARRREDVKLIEDFLAAADVPLEEGAA